MARRAPRKTDYGTIILHWSLVLLLAIAVGTGLRIAIDSPYDLRWLRALDWLLPQSIVWTAHIPAGAALIALAISYAIYMARTGLFGRIRPDMARLKGLAGARRARLGALNIALYWMLFLSLLVQLATGTLLYLGHGGLWADAHLLATWVLVAYAPVHILIHYTLGGRVQLMRIFRPARLPPAPAPFDPFELIALKMRPEARMDARKGKRKLPRITRTIIPEKTPRGMARGRGGEMLRANAFATAIAGGFGFLVFLLSLDNATRDTLTINEIAASRRPALDGDLSDPVWRTAKPVRVRTQQGSNLDGKGGSMVEVRAVHDGMNAYFAFVWEDPTRSLKHVPLIKREWGWEVLHEGFDHEDANAFFEDKLAVLFISAYVLIPGDRTFHAGRQPLPDKPASFSGRGMHYTTAEGVYADMWQWHASSGGLLGWIDDTHFGPPAGLTDEQRRGLMSYKGGFAPDPGSAFYSYNFEQRGPGGYRASITPKRLPRSWRKSWNALGEIDLNPHNGDAEGSVWWLTEDDSVPYSAEADARIPVGCIIPGVVISGAYTGDRADIRGAARWAAGRWTLEAVRKLDTGSKYDARIGTGTYMRVSVFDHTQSRHTRHIRPIRLEVNRCENPAECMSTIKDLPQGEASFF